ncbi:hypothetical protein GCM10018965_000020 [Nonomuraea roseola]
MKDSGFHVPAGKIDRLPPLYAPDPKTGKLIVWDEAAGGRVSRPPAFQSAAAVGWSPPSTTTTPTSGCCSTAGCTAASGSCRGPLLS